MLNVVGVVLAFALAGAAGWLTRRRSDVLDYHRIDTTANRVGQRWLWSRHGSR